MAYQAAPYSDLDYLTAILMGESGARDDARAMGALADVVMNRVNGTQSPRTAYGDSFTYNPNSVAGQVTATFRGAPQFSSADRAQAQREGTGAAYDNYNNALTRGAEAFSGAARDRYNQARAVASSFLDQSDPNYGRYSGVSGGSDFFVARGYPTYLRGGRYDSQTIGGSDFFKLKSNGGFTPWNDPGDRGVMSALPPAGSDLTGDGFDASQGAGLVGPGGLGMGTGVIETGNPFDFGGANVSGGVGPGFNNLGGAVPYGDVNPLAFAGGRNVAGAAGPGLFSNFLPPMQTGGGYDFSGLDAGAGVANGSFGAGIYQPGPAPGAYDFAGGLNPSQGVGNGVIGQLPPGFSAEAYYRANPDVAASGMDAATHYLSFGMQEGRALGPTTVSAGSFPSQTATALLPDGGIAATAPGLTPALGPSFTSSIGPTSFATAIGPTMTQALPPNFSPQDYIAANGDLAGMSNQQAIDHFVNFGRFENRALAPWLPQQVYAAAPPALSPAINTATTATAQGPTFTPAIGPTDVPAIGPQDTPALGPTTTAFDQGPGQIFRAFDGGEYLKANADVAAAGQDPLQHFLRYGMAEGRALDTAGHHLNQNFDGTAYLAQNQDVARAGLDPLLHYLTNGAAEGRSYTTGLNPYQFSGANVGGGTGAQATGFSGLTPLASPPPSQPIGSFDFGGANVSGGVAPGSFMPAGFQPSGPAYSGAGIGNPLGFSNANVGGGLGATAQSFGTAYPLDTNVGYSSGGSPGGGGSVSDPFSFSGADVGGFDVNAASPPMEGGQGGGGGGGGTAKGSSSSAAFLADQARTRAYWDSLVKPAELYGNTNTHTTPVVGAPVVPNLTVSNLALGAPGAMFSAFAPWR